MQLRPVSLFLRLVGLVKASGSSLRLVGAVKASESCFKASGSNFS